MGLEGRLLIGRRAGPLAGSAMGSNVVEERSLIGPDSFPPSIGHEIRADFSSGKKETTNGNKRSRFLG